MALVYSEMFGKQFNWGIVIRQMAYTTLSYDCSQTADFATSSNEQHMFIQRLFNCYADSY